MTAVKSEGRLAGAIRMFFEEPRSDEEAVAYLRGWHDAAALLNHALRGAE